MNVLRRSPNPDPRRRANQAHRRRAWLLLAPGVLWLLLWFVLPLAGLIPVSLSKRLDPLSMQLVFTGQISAYQQVLERHGLVLLRSIGYATASTALALMIAYPLAWVIRFRSCRLKAVLLALVVVPFFTSYLVRAIALTTLLSDQGPILTLLHRLGLEQNTAVLNSALAVVLGLTYNALPYTVLPIALSLERLSPDLLDAARDLHASAWDVFRRVVLPLSSPGLAAAVVLSLIPSVGDLISPQFLGGPNDRMVANVIQNLMVVQRHLPRGAALSLLLMLLMAPVVLLYVRRHGSEDLTLP